jgi:hypothetical protein
LAYAVNRDQEDIKAGITEMFSDVLQLREKEKSEKRA